MADRQKYQYTVITYLPDKIRNERVNIGILFSSITGSDVYIKMIPGHSNRKLKGLVHSRYEQKLYDTSISYLEYCVNKVNTNDLTFMHDSNLLKSIVNLKDNDLFPEELLLSSIRTVTTADINTIISKIIDTYIGSEFFENSKKNVVNLKKVIYEEFYSQKLIGTKVRHSFPMQPDKKVNWKINVDFAFSQGNKLNILQTVPSNESALDTWYPKVKTFSSEFGNSTDNLVILSDLSQSINDDNKVSQMLSSIQESSSSSIENIDVSGEKGLSQLTSTIKEKADSIVELNKLLKDRTSA